MDTIFGVFVVVAIIAAGFIVAKIQHKEPDGSSKGGPGVKPVDGKGGDKE